MHFLPTPPPHSWGPLTISSLIHTGSPFSSPVQCQIILDWCQAFQLSYLHRVFHISWTSACNPTSECWHSYRFCLPCFCQHRTYTRLFHFVFCLPLCHCLVWLPLLPSLPVLTLLCLLPVPRLFYGGFTINYLIGRACLWGTAEWKKRTEPACDSRLFLKS